MTIRKKNMSQRMLNPTRFTMTAIATACILASATVHAETAITNLSVAQTSKQTTQLRLDFDQSPSTPEAYQLDGPSRLVLDFEEVSNELDSSYAEFNKGAIKHITTLNNDTTTRLIIGLNETADKNFTTVMDGNALLININDTRQDSASDKNGYNTKAYNSYVNDANTAEHLYIGTDYKVTDSAKSGSTTAPLTLTDSTKRHFESQSDSSVNGSQSKPKQTMTVKVNPLLNPALANQSAQKYDYNGVTSVNYTPASNGGGSINIGLANESIPVDIQRQGNKVLVHINSARIPSNLIRQHNINGGLVSSVNARNSGKNGIITITMSGDFEYQAFQSGSQVNIDVKPPKLLREPTLEEKKYTGDPISVDFQNVELRSVLHLLSQFTEMNIIASDSVSGNITLNLVNVPWDQALDIILKSKNLGMRANGNVILIAPATELAEQEAKELEALQKVDTFLPLRTEYIRLSYARAKDVLTLISQGKNAGRQNIDRNDSGSLLSDRGTVTIDERTNTLIVKDTSSSIENIRSLTDKIDIPVRQVMIEARIVSASDNFSKELGVKWGILSDGAATNRDLLVGGSDRTLQDLKDFTVESTTINGQTVSYPSYDIDQKQRLNVDLGVQDPAGRIAFGLLSLSDIMIDLELSAMQADGRGEVISSPKILTMDKQTAKVSSGTQIPYQEAAASGATSTSFVEAALSLEATPNITPDGKIALELNISNGSPVVYNGETAISEDTLSTNVIVEDGQTVVLGGIFRNTKDSSVTKVPFLGDLPYVGKLFRKNTSSNRKDELLIFVTPKLINDGTSIN